MSKSERNALQIINKMYDNETMKSIIYNDYIKGCINGENMEVIINNTPSFNKGMIIEDIAYNGNEIKYALALSINVDYVINYYINDTIVETHKSDLYYQYSSINVPLTRFKSLSKEYDNLNAEQALEVIIKRG